MSDPVMVVALVLRAIEKGRTNVHAIAEYVEELLSDEDDPEGLQKLLDSLDEDFGPVPPEVIAEADEEFIAHFGDWLRENRKTLPARGHGGAA